MDMRYSAPVFPANSPKTTFRVCPTVLGGIGSYAAGFLKIAAKCVPALCLKADSPTIGFESYGFIVVYCSISLERSTSMSNLKSFGDLYRYASATAVSARDGIPVLSPIPSIVVCI